MSVERVRSIEQNLVALSGATPGTRVHVMATRFVGDRALEHGQALPAIRPPQATRFNKNLASYVSGRDIGDEYRYVLERRNAPRREPPDGPTMAKRVATRPDGEPRGFSPHLRPSSARPGSTRN